MEADVASELKGLREAGRPDGDSGHRGAAPEAAVWPRDAERGASGASAAEAMREAMALPVAELKRRLKDPPRRRLPTSLVASGACRDAARRVYKLRHPNRAEGP